MSMGKLRFAVSCSSNMNRSMEAHSFLQKRGFNVESFGSGSQVKLPGPTPDRPNCYDFGVATYDFIYNDLKQKDPQLYTQNGLLNMLDRNRRIKDMPQKFQHFSGKFDVIICLEERVYDQIVEDLQTRDTNEGDSVHVINIDIQDNHEEATIGALFVCDLCAKTHYTVHYVMYMLEQLSLTTLEACEDLDNEIDEVLTEFEQNNTRRNILHTICFY
ncbi:RNA polymerase II subunit A C-terminal domain phosphatase SSU72 [Dirofilaria immitis]|nr:RNA polymerase II subunit A C-terminal domain phosphatase SSU72 [Dirofilaria immitis]